MYDRRGRRFEAVRRLLGRRRRRLPRRDMRQARRAKRLYAEARWRDRYCWSSTGFIFGVQTMRRYCRHD